MKKYLLAGAMLALMTGGAMAQSTYTDTTTRVTPSGDQSVQVDQKSVNPDGSTTDSRKTYNSSNSAADPGAKNLTVKRSEKITDSNGNQTEKSKTYSKGDDGTSVTSKSRTTAPDGTQETTTEKRTNNNEN